MVSIGLRRAELWQLDNRKNRGVLELNISGFMDGIMNFWF